MAGEISAATRRQQLALILDTRPALLLHEGYTLQGVAGTRCVGRPLCGGQLGVRPLGGPFVSEQLLERRRGDRRVRVEHSVRQVLRCVERARPLDTTM